MVHLHKQICIIFFTYWNFCLQFLCISQCQKTTKTVKNIAGSKIVKDTGKQLLDSTITGLTNVAADTISGSKTINESLSDELKNARSEISTALKKANKSRKFEAADEIPSPKPKKRKKARKKTAVKYKRRTKQSIFDEDD